RAPDVPKGFPLPVRLNRGSDGAKLWAESSTPGQAGADNFEKGKWGITAGSVGTGSRMRSFQAKDIKTMSVRSAAGCRKRFARRLSWKPNCLASWNSREFR